MALHQRFALFPGETHEQDVLQGDEVRAVFGDEHVLGRPALIRRVGLERGIEAHHLEKVERDAVWPRHGEDRAPVALLRGKARLAQLAPRLARLVVARHRRAPRRAATRLELRLFQRPGEDVLLRLCSRREEQEREGKGGETHARIVLHTAPP